MNAFKWGEAEYPKEEESEEFQLLEEIIDDQWIEKNVIYMHVYVWIYEFVCVGLSLGAPTLWKRERRSPCGKLRLSVKKMGYR